MPSIPGRTAAVTISARSRRTREPHERRRARCPRPAPDEAGGRRRWHWPGRSLRLPATAVLALVLALALGSAVPSPPAQAQEGEGPGAALQIGAAAEIANADGDEVLLREGPGYDAGVLATLAEGTPLALTDGPIAAADGSVWWAVEVGDRSGYVVSDYLAAPGAGVPPEPSPEAAGESPTAAGETATAREVVDLGTAPDEAAAVLAVVPAGGVVTRSGDAAGGFLPVVYEGLTGYAAIAALTLGAGPAEALPAATEAAVETAQPATDERGTPFDAAGATATADVELRAGPGAGEPVLLVVPAGADLAPTGEATAGFLGVSYQGTTGWIDAAYLAAVSVAAEQPVPEAPAAAEAVATPVAAPATPAATPDPADDPSPPAIEVGEAPPGEPAVANDVGNLRAGPSYSEPVLRVLPPGGEVVVTGAASGEFLPVWYNGTDGWIAVQFLDGGAGTATPAVEAAGVAGAGESGETGETGESEGDDAPEPAAGGGGLVWPVSGGSWEIMQGYNGSSHQNEGGTWQYYYSLDLAREDGATAGQSVSSPAAGTVRWLDPSTGGISIDIGDGHAVALFHVAIDGGIGEGDPIRQGQYLGTISGPGGPGFAGTPHVHFALWETTDGGNWSRAAAPFVGAYAIAGAEFPDIGGGNQYQGTGFAP